MNRLIPNKGKYIPTTDEVENRYVQSRIYLVDFSEKKARKEFKRWLNELQKEYQPLKVAQVGPWCESFCRSCGMGCLGWGCCRKLVERVDV